MKNFVIIGLLILVLFLVWISRKKSTFADVKAKKAEEKCPDGYREMGPVVCVKD
jgi:Na+-transporting methylmalonyl-CoA/oxaloacetate decarboxylase gamma subunit